MHSRLLFLIILSFFTFQLYAIPTNYFISPTGNDANNGLTSTTPKATLANVFSFNLGAGDTIFVAAGTYSEKGIVVGNNDEGFVIQGAALDAAGVPTSIFDSDQTDRWLIFGFDKSDNISFRNIMIKNYKGKGSFSGSGGAICINGKDCINLSISNCIFDNCDSELNGGAIFFNYLSSRNSTWNINNCIFKNCTSSFKGGAIYLSSGDDLDVNISKCVFYSNSTDNDYGSAIWYDGATGSLLTMTNCLLYNNSIGGAGNYGVIYVHNNPIANIVNCTITNNNSLATSVGGVFFNGGGSTLTNCIVYGNTTKDVYRASGTINLKYCCYKTHQGCSPSNSFTTDPGFKSPGTNDYSLATGSGCIDKGTASGAPNDDILSAPRPMGLGYDVGAYESSPCSVNAASSTPTVCINSPLTNITHTTTGATGIINDGVLAANGLPAGLKAIFTGNATAGTITISGTPTADGTFTYSIPLTVGCGSVNATGTIKVDKASVGGSLSADQKLCLGTSATDISMINAVGKIQWQKSTNNTPFADITGATGATLTTATIGTLIDTAYFRAVVTSGVCSSTNSPSVKIAVYPLSALGTLSADQKLCLGTSATDISMTNPIGKIQWQKSTDNTSFSDITGATGATLSSATIGSLPDTAYFRAVVTSGVCSSTNSQSVKIAVYPLSALGTLSADQKLCLGSSATDISMTTPIGKIQWQKSTNNTPFADITGATGATLTTATIGTLIDTAYFRAVVTSGVCSSTNSPSVKIAVYPLSALGTLSADQKLCLGTSATDISMTNPIGKIQWQKSTDNTSFSDITGATGATLSSATIGSLPDTAYFRAVVKSGVCSSTNSQSVKIAVYPLSALGTLSADQKLCLGSSATDISMTTPIGKIQWQKSTNNTLFTDITGATGTTLPNATIGSLPDTTYFRAVVTSGVCSSLNSSSVKIAVFPLSALGTLSVDQKLCLGTSATDISMTNPIGKIQWQKSTDNTSFIDITGATGATLTSATIGSLPDTAYYRAVIKSGVCSSTNSPSVKIAVYPLSALGTLSADQKLCLGSSATDISMTTPIGKIQWQKSTNNTLFTDITGATGTTLPNATIGSLPDTTYFRAVVTSGVCSSLNSSSVKIAVFPLSALGTLSVDQKLCLGTSATDISMTNPIGKIQWQKSTDNTSFIDITGATGATLPNATIGPLTDTAYYRAVVKSGVCSSTNSPSVKIAVYPLSALGTLSADQKLCLGTSATDISMTTPIGKIQWQKSTNNTLFTDITGATGTTLPNATIGSLPDTTYFRAVVTSGVCSSLNSSSVKIAVFPLSALGTLSADQKLCLGTSATDISMTNPIGKIQWQKSTDNTSFSDITGATGATLSSATIGSLPDTAYFRAVVKSGVCSSTNSQSVKIAVYPLSALGTLSADQKLCLGSSATDISMINAVGKIQWQKSTNNILFTDITGATGATLTSATIGTLTDTAYFRAVVTSGVCSSTNSPSVKIAVYPTPKTPVLDKTKVYCKSDISLNLTNIKFTSPALASSQQYFVFYKAGLPILPELLNNANGNYQVAFFDGECLGDKLTFNFPTDIQLNPGPTLTNPLSDVVMCQNEKPDLARVESKASLPTGTVSWYATSNDLNPIIKSTKVTNTNTTYYLSIMDNVTNCMNETRFPIVVKLNSGENIQLNPLFGLCSNTSYTVAYLDKSVTNDLSKGTIKWYNDNILPIVGQSLSKNDKVDFTKSYYAVYVPTNNQLCSSDIKELLPMNLVTVTVNPILPLSQTNQGFCYEPVRFVSDLNFLPYNSSEIQVFSEASNSNAKLDLVEKLISAPYYIKTKKVLINTTCYSDNFTTINVNVNKPALETETHFSNCGKKNGYIKLTSYPNNAIITWYKDNILLSDNSDVLKGLDKGEFKIVINDNGCVRSKKVELNDCVPSEIPHIITPNNDSKNDLWVLGYYEKYPNVSVQIMNRWGNKVFESDKPYKDNWDGKNMNGEFLPTGTYFYLIDKGNGEQVISGFVEFVK